MMSLWDALRMNMMISYQELVRTFLNFHRFLLTLTTKGFWRKNEKDITYVESAIFYYRGL
ncbi:hypothetical protein ESCOMM041B_16385 [Escherichia coli]